MACRGLGQIETGIESTFKEPLNRLSKLASSSKKFEIPSKEKSSSRLNEFQHELVRPGKEAIVSVLFDGKV